MQLSDYMDYVCRPEDDLCSTTGFISAVRGILKLEPMGLATIGLPCGSFVWMNAATSKRSESSPFGNEELPYVAAANKISARVCLLILLLTARQSFFMLEQPSSSKLEHVPYFQHMMNVVSATVKVHKVSFWMGTYGHFSCKRSLAYSNLHFIPSLAKRLSMVRRRRLGLSSDGVVTRRKVGGKTAVTGDKKLKSTQEYPQRFCRKVFKLHMKSRDAWLRNSCMYWERESRTNRTVNLLRTEMRGSLSRR
ncbi:unnamed protein product [Symbiodinium sp. CCMP2592]|nr:unnamed protein product [Symbiodinium sp. CCMP2592]